MAADFQLVLGANYSQLERDLKIATDIALKWSDNARQQAIFNIQTKVNKQSLNASLAEMNKAIEKATSKVADENRIFNLFTTKKKLFSRQVDFREGIESTDQLIQRINELRNLLRGMDTGRIKVISGENAEEARQLSDQIDALQKRISVLKNGSSKKGIKEFENMSIKLNEAKKEANNLKVALDSLKNSGRHGKAFDREVRNLEDALQRANNKVKEFQANVRMLGKNNKTISDFDSLNKQLYEAELRMEALLEKSQKDTNAKENIQALIEVYRELFRIISQGERDMLRGINQIDKEEQKAARKAEQETSKLTKKQKAALEDILKKKEQINNLRSNLTSKDDLDSLRVNRDIIQQIYNIQKSLIGKRNSGIDNATLAKTKSELDEIISKINIAQKQLKAANKDLHTHSGIFKDLLNYAKMYLSVWQFFRVNRQIVETTGFFEQQAQALRSIIQDAPKANALFNQLKQYSLQSPLTFQELVENTKKLTAYQIPTEDLFETTKRLADLSSGLGVEINRIILAYGQIRAASVLRGQEVRQLTEAGIPIINELANAFSNLEGRAVSTAEVFKKISERGVSFEMIKDILWNMTSEGGKFYNMQEKLMNTDIYGPMQKMKDQWKLSLNDMGTSMKGLYAFILKGITAIEKSWRVALGGLIGFAISKIVNPAFTMTQRIVSMQLKAASKVKLAWRLVASSIKGFFKANLFSIVTTGISLIIGKIVQLNAETRRLKNEIADIEKDYANKASELADNFIILVNALKGTNKESKEEEKIMNKLKSAYSDILPLSELNADKLRNETTAYKDLTTAIIASVDAELQREKILKKRQLLNSNIDKIASSEKSKNDAIKASPTVFDNMVNMIKKNIYTKTEEEMKNIVKTYLVAYKSYNDLPTGNYAVLNRVIEKSYKEFDKYSQNVEYTGILDRRAELASYMGENAASYLEDNKSILDELIKIEDELSLINNPEKQDIVQSYIDKIGLFGLKIPENSIVSDLASGKANNKDIQDFFNSVKSVNSGSTNLAGKSFLDNIIKKVVNEFVWLGDNEEKINAIIDNSGIPALNSLKWKSDTTLYEYQEELQKVYNAAESNYNNQVNKNTEDAKTQLDIIKKVKEIDGLVNYDVTSNSKEGKKDLTERQKIEIDEQRTAFQNLRNAFNAYNNMIKYVSQESAKTTLNDIFKGMFTGEGNPNEKEYWKSTFESIYNKVFAIDKSAAESLKNDFENMFPVDAAKDEISKIKKELEDIDRVFSRSSNAREYFKELIDAGVAWEYAIKYAKEIDSTFSIGKEMSSLMADKVMNYVRFAGIEVPDDKLNSIESIDYMEKYVRNNLSEQTEIFNPLISALEALRKQIQLENVAIEKYSYENYSPFGVYGKAAPDIVKSFGEYSSANTTEGVSGAIEQLNKLYALSEKNTLIYGSKTGIGIEAIKVALEDNNTDLANKIADTMPFGDMLRKSIDNNKNGDINKVGSAYGIIAGIGEYSDNLTNVAEGLIAVVEEIDSVIEAFGGKVDKNDALHTMLNAFNGISSSISGMFTSALKLDIGGVLSNLVGIITKPIKAIIYAGDNQLQEAIENLNKDIEAIDNAINNLKREAELLYGDAAWEKTAQEYSKMQTKLVELNNKVNLEKAKKNPDDDAVTEYENAVTDMQLQMKEFNSSIRDELIGTVDDWSSRLGNALRDAFENGKNAARSWKETVDSLINDMIYNMIITESLQPVIDGIMENVMNKAKESYSGKTETDAYKQMKQYYQGFFGVSDEAFEKAWESTGLDKYETDPKALIEYFTDKSNVDELKQELGAAYEPIMKILENANLINTSSSSAASNSLQSMTEDTANRLLALWNTNMLYIMKIDSNTIDVSANLSSIQRDINAMKGTTDNISQAVNDILYTIDGYFGDWNSGAKKIHVFQN